MVQMVMKKVKNEKGLTLIELLAVVVILGIIAAIAIPAIGGIIDNSKKDAHAANATQMIHSAKIAAAGDTAARPNPGGTIYLTLRWLEEQGYIDQVRNPDSSTTPYTRETGTAATAPSATQPGVSAVQIVADTNGALTYSVFLTNGTRWLGTATSYLPEASISRAEVKK